MILKIAQRWLRCLRHPQELCQNPSFSTLPHPTFSLSVSGVSSSQPDRFGSGENSLSPLSEVRHPFSFSQPVQPDDLLLNSQIQCTPGSTQVKLSRRSQVNIEDYSRIWIKSKLLAWKNVLTLGKDWLWPSQKCKNKVRLQKGVDLARVSYKNIDFKQIVYWNFLFCTANSCREGLRKVSGQLPSHFFFSCQAMLTCSWSTGSTVPHLQQNKYVFFLIVLLLSVLLPSFTFSVIK